MDIPKYDGNIHPDEWINDIRKYHYIWKVEYEEFLNIVISLIDPTIKLPTEISDIEELPLRHVATGKYLSSVENLCYKTGSKLQLVFVRGSDPGPNSLWKIQFNKELATYTDTSITLQHTKSNKLLGISWYGSGNSYSYQKSPTFGSTEVNCGGNASEWKFNYSKSEENHESYLKSNDIIYLSIKKSVDRSGRTTHIGSVEFLRCHDVRFTIGNDNFQEIVCHNERLGANDDWCIELIEQCA
ncbi:hypothetical protein GLOIN_2v1543797 [Rhizophagus irregularis DAOM 181602=DAOM 197198]|nr:hypothetical protein GLOIN_2v1543797 [Rhizophagus irregularis DAOM 181602=DAOM 197198]